MSKRPEPPSPSTSSLTGSAPKKQQMNSNFFNKPSASSSSSTSNGGKKLDPRFREQPKLPSKTTKGACHVIYGDWKASSKIAGLLFFFIFDQNSRLFFKIIDEAI